MNLQAGNPFCRAQYKTLCNPNSKKNYDRNLQTPLTEILYGHSLTYYIGTWTLTLWTLTLTVP